MTVLGERIPVQQTVLEDIVPACDPLLETVTQL